MDALHRKLYEALRKARENAAYEDYGPLEGEGYFMLDADAFKAWMAEAAEAIEAYENEVCRCT